MKFNRSKIGIVVIVASLSLAFLLPGCMPGTGSKAPDFLEVGGIYEAKSSGQVDYDFTVLEIRNDGWILAEEEDWGEIWINTTQLVHIRKE